MKKKSINLASRLALLALAVTAVVCFTSCSKNEDAPAEETLSDKTTPVTFKFDKYTYPVFFDYTENWRYLCADTVKSLSTRKTVDLRQGKHNIVAVKDIYFPSSYLEWPQSPGVHFNPEERSFYLESYKNTYIDLDSEPVYNVAERDVYYWQTPLEVSPYLLPEQTPDFTPVTATLMVVQTDKSQALELLEKGYSLRMEVPDVPVVEEVGLNDNRKKMRQEPYTMFAQQSSFNNYVVLLNKSYITLCPKDGLQVDRLTLNTKTIGKNGESQVRSVVLPAFSMRRGCYTILRGPYLTGSEADWTVEVVPYADYKDEFNDNFGF